MKYAGDTYDKLTDKVVGKDGVETTVSGSQT
jgi:hypothetical protein